MAYSEQYCIEHVNFVSVEEYRGKPPTTFGTMNENQIAVFLAHLKQGKAIRFREPRDMDDVWYGYDVPSGRVWYARVSFYTPDVFAVSYFETEAEFRKFMASWTDISTETEFANLIAQLEDDPRPN